jgi:hypothetical protein
MWLSSLAAAHQRLAALKKKSKKFSDWLPSYCKYGHDVPEY